MKKVGVLSYGTGNLLSVLKSINSVGATPKIVTSSSELIDLDALILPGVGHFGAAMHYLSERNLLNVIQSVLKDGLPTLGICLGFQLLCSSSEEESSIFGLKHFPLVVTRLRQEGLHNIKVPQIGWNSLSTIHGSPRLLEGLKPHERLFYFANSFGVRAETVTLIGARYFHGCEYFGLVELGNFFGVQFHPEKSGVQGLTVLKNFIGLLSETRPSHFLHPS